MSHHFNYKLSTWILLCLFSLALVFGIMFNVQEKRQLHKRFDGLVELVEVLNSGISVNDKRKKTILAMYSKIVKLNPKISKTLAFEIASYNYVVAADVYKFDPFLLFAIQQRESFFDPTIKSEAGAVGLNQMMPTTAMMCAGALGWQWRDELLTDPFRNTDMAGYYIDLLYSQFKKTEAVLAYYNGGNAGYRCWKTGKGMSKETKDYIEAVTRYQNEIKKMDGIGNFNFSTVVPDSVRLDLSKNKK